MVVIHFILNSSTARAETEKQTRRSQELWLACLNLCDRIAQATAAAPGGASSTTEDDTFRPLIDDVVKIRDLGSGHPFVETMVDSFPEESLSRGICSEASLYERFERVYTVARRVALIDERGGSPLRYLGSYIANLLVVTHGTVLDDDSMIDENVSQFALLDSARHHARNGNFEVAVRLVNQLRGEPRKVAGEWLREAILTLEAKQAAQCLMAHSASEGLTSLM